MSSPLPLPCRLSLGRTVVLTILCMRFAFVCIGNWWVSVGFLFAWFGFKYRLSFRLKLYLSFTWRGKVREKTPCQKQKEEKNQHLVFLRHLWVFMDVTQNCCLSSGCQTLEARRLGMYIKKCSFFRKRNGCTPMSTTWLWIVMSSWWAEIWVFWTLVRAGF